MALSDLIRARYASRADIDPTTVTLALSSDEALVLYEYLSRTAAARTRGLLMEDQSELRVLWDVENLLQARLPEVTAPDYGDRLDAARAAVREDVA